MWRTAFLRPTQINGHRVWDFAWATREGHQEGGLYFISRIVVAPLDEGYINSFIHEHGRPPRVKVFYGGRPDATDTERGTMEFLFPNMNTVAWVVPADGRLSILEIDGLRVRCELVEVTTPSPAIVQAALRPDA